MNNFEIWNETVYKLICLMNKRVIMKYLLSVLLVSLNIQTWAQLTVNARVLHQISRSDGYIIHADANGNILVGGQLNIEFMTNQNVIDFDASEAEELVTITGSEDGFLCKLNPQGEILWARTFGGEEDSPEWVWDITTDSEGNIYVAGNFSDYCDFDPSAAENILYGALTDGYLLKLSPNGDLIWVREISSSSGDRAHGVALKPNGEILVSGFMNADGFVGDLNDYLTIEADGGILCSFNSDGTVNWAKVLESSSLCNLNRIDVGNDGSIFGVGIFSGELDLDPSNNEYLVTAIGDEDGFYVKFDAVGNFVWGGSFGSLEEDWAYDLAVNDQLELFITGHVKDTTFIGSPGNMEELSIGSISDLLMAKISNAGEVAWAHTIPASGRSHCVSVDNSGNAVFGGYFNLTADFDPSENVAELERISNNDLFLVRYNSTGEFENAYVINGDGSQIARSIHISEENTLYVTGTTSDTVDFDPGIGEFLLSSESSRSYFLKIQEGPSSTVDLDLFQTSIYPNPVLNGQTLTLQDGIGWVRIFDLSGKLCFIQEIQEQIETIPLNLAAGQYLVEIQGSEGRSLQKLQVE